MNVGMGMYGKAQLKFGALKLKFLCVFFARGVVPPLPVGAASPTPLGIVSPPQSEGINPVLPEETIMTFPEAVTMLDNAVFPQEPLPQQLCF